LIFSAGALAFVANMAILRPAELPPNVAVASADLLPGTIFNSALHVEFVPMTTDPGVLGTLVLDTGYFDGQVVNRRVDAGALLPRAALTEQGGLGGHRVMSLAVDPERAAGGNLVVGDFVDVIAVESGQARYVVTGLEIVALPEQRSSSFASSGRYHLVVLVDAASALELSAALDSSSIQVIRSSGAAPMPGEPDAG
jgi:Flp pilus assembly protein CpaB